VIGLCFDYGYEQEQAFEKVFPTEKKGVKKNEKRF
jgi:hypothetical protein